MEFLKTVHQRNFGGNFGIGEPELIANEMLKVFRVDAKPEEIEQSLGLASAK